MRPWFSLASRSLVAAALTVAVLGGCSKDTSSQKGLPPAAKLPGDIPVQPSLPQAPAAPPAAAPGATAPAATAGGQPATVLETMNSGGYTYARLDLGGEEVWAAAPETTLTVGAKVSFVPGSLMTNFHSNTLDRTFPQIHFVPGLPLAGAAGAAAAPLPPGHPDTAAMPPGHPGTAGTAATPPAGHPAPTPTPAPTEQIAPVEGGQTIAALTAAAASLSGKPVVARGKVTKFNAGIMGKNWIHVHDGTADLTVTTAGTAAPVAVGDIVVVRGTLATNKDFGAGYSYPVIVEDATLAAK